jgi:hypothetical protein
VVDAFELAEAIEFELFGLAGVTIIRGFDERQDELQFRLFMGDQIGIPALRYFLLGAIVVGAEAALVIRALRGNTPGATCTLFAPSADARSQQNDSTDAPPDSHRCMLRVVSPVA